MCIISVAPMPLTNCVPVVAVHASCVDGGKCSPADTQRSEEHTSELQSLMRISYAVFCLKTKTRRANSTTRAEGSRARTSYQHHRARSSVKRLWTPTTTP